MTIQDLQDRLRASMLSDADKLTAAALVADLADLTARQLTGEDISGELVQVPPVGHAGRGRSADRRPLTLCQARGPGRLSWRPTLLLPLFPSPLAWLYHLPSHDHGSRYALALLA